MRTSDQLARLRVAIGTGHLPRDLGTWLLQQLMAPADRRRQRDKLLRSAAACYSGSKWARAKEVHAILEDLRENPEHMNYVDMKLSAAFTIDPEHPRSLRRILDIID